jgi:hypothetical protein
MNIAHMALYKKWEDLWHRAKWDDPVLIRLFENSGIKSAKGIGNASKVNQLLNEQFGLADFALLKRRCEIAKGLSQMVRLCARGVLAFLPRGSA